MRMRRTVLGLATAALVASTMIPGAAFAAGKSYTLAQVKAHKSASSCWSVVNGKVYSLTPWIKRHPGGGGVIKSMCGRDATAAFKAQHGLIGRAATQLAAFRIGAVKKTASPSGTSSPSATATPTPTSSSTVLSAAVVAQHASSADCWSIVNGSVYNLTGWIGLHPGGSGVISAMCGIDASAAYTAQHRTQSKPAGKLAAYRLGAIGDTIK